jgi:hypothetical protein
MTDIYVLEVKHDPNSLMVTQQVDITISKKGKRWTPKEDEVLSQAVQELGKRNWRRISERVSGRSAVQCLHRWNKILKPGLTKGPWTPAEDEMLTSWVSKHGASHWSSCAKAIKGRNGKQCRERWNNILSPSIKKGSWTYEEDLRIIELYFQIGSKWSQMVSHLNGRSENAIKNRFYSNLRKMMNMKRRGVQNSEAPQDLSEVAHRNKIIMSYDEFLMKKSYTDYYKHLTHTYEIQAKLIRKTYEEMCQSMNSAYSFSILPQTSLDFKTSIQ